MKKRLKAVFIFFVFMLSTFSFSVTANDYNTEVDYSLWDKFLKCDLCITDYNSLTQEKQELCKFIFETEQSATGTVRCERARRTLAGDENMGDRLNVDELIGAYGVWDNYSFSKCGWQSYIHCVPDIKCFDGWNDYNEYWTDDEGTVRIRFTGENSGSKWQSFKIMGDFSYEDYKNLSAEHDEVTWDSDQNLCEVTAKKMPKIMTTYDSVSGQTIEDYSNYTEFEGNYYFINADNTVTLIKSSLSTKNFDGGMEPYNETIVIPEKVNGCTVTAIGAEAFQCSPVTHVILPDTIKFIDSRAFEYCEYLEKINFPTSLKYIGWHAFSDCAMSEIDINCPDLNISIWSFSLHNLTDAKLNVKSIGEEAFWNCVSLKNITLGDSVESIGANAFKNCGTIENINFPLSLKSIGTGAFLGDVKLDKLGIKSVTIPPTVEIIGALPMARGEAATSGIYYPSTHPLTDEQPCVFDKDCVIYGYKGTEAERYAKEWKLDFVALEAVMGDSNFDGKCNIADVVNLQKWILAKPNSKMIYWQAADLYDDDKLDVFDLILLKRAFNNSTGAPYFIEE